MFCRLCCVVALATISSMALAGVKFIASGEVTGIIGVPEHIAVGDPIRVEVRYEVENAIDRGNGFWGFTGTSYLIEARITDSRGRVHVVSTPESLNDENSNGINDIPGETVGDLILVNDSQNGDLIWFTSNGRHEIDGDFVDSFRWTHRSTSIRFFFISPAGLTSTDLEQEIDLVSFLADTPRVDEFHAITIGEYSTGGGIQAPAVQIFFALDTYLPPLPGDANYDLRVDVSDAITILQWLYLGGRAPDELCAADANGDERVDLSDAVTILEHLFLDDAAPADACAVR